MTKGLLISLSQGREALVSPEDYPEQSQHLWSYDEWGRGADSGYAIRYAKKGGPDLKGRGKLYLHREIVKPPDGWWVDHINGDRLDCRRENLRLATPRQNWWNRKSTNKTGYRGVSRTVNRTFRARLTADTVKNKSGHLGVFKTAEEAARAHDIAALEAYGAFAIINFPREDYPELTEAAVSREDEYYADIPF